MAEQFSAEQALVAQFIRQHLGASGYYFSPPGSTAAFIVRDGMLRRKQGGNATTIAPVADALAMREQALYQACFGTTAVATPDKGKGKNGG